jgi:NAD(P) transhydrogenase subunit alpha
MMKDMKPGSVIIDLAAETGGNVEGSKPGVDTMVAVGKSGGLVTLVGMKDVPSTMAFDASRLYAKNVSNLLTLMTKDNTVVPDFEDEVVAGACLTHDGEIRHEPTAQAMAAPAKEKKGAK